MNELIYHEDTDGMMYPDLTLPEMTNYPKKRFVGRIIKRHIIIAIIRTQEYTGQ